MKQFPTTGVWRKPIEGRVSEAFLDGFGQDSFRAKESDRDFRVTEVPKLNSLGASGRIESMKGYRSCYKARFGAYRIGMTLKSDTLTFERALHRKDIYRFFP